MLVRGITRLGSYVLRLSGRIGSFSLFFAVAAATLVSKPLKKKQIIMQSHHIGVGSLGIIMLTGSFTGLALALQSYIGFHRFGAEEFVGLVVTLGMVRELGPVLTALMVTGRAGSAMAAEIATMQITEQVDALKTLGINPYQYLVVPRVIASVCMVPVLTLFAMACGIISSYFLCTIVLKLNPALYLAIIKERVELGDIIGGLIKSCCFGLIISSIGTYYGFTTRGGAQDVGRATTQSVVAGSVAVLIANYFLSTLLFQAGVA